MNKVRVATAAQMQHIDTLAIEKLRIPSAVLMENAGQAVSREVVRMLKGKPLVSVVCGCGNNGGDGFVAARYLFNTGVKTKIFVLGDTARLKKDALINFEILKRLKADLIMLKNLNTFRRALKKSGLLIDAIFGLGLNREISGLACIVIKEMNASKKPIVAVDIPSGLDATSGKIHGICVNARRTITFTLAKKGFFLRYGPRQTGKIIIADIGIPPKLYQS